MIKNAGSKEQRIRVQGIKAMQNENCKMQIKKWKKLKAESSWNPWDTIGTTNRPPLN
jgi:hypothetical protein